MITDSKRSYFKDKIEENSKSFFTIIEKVLHRKAESALHKQTCQKVPAENISTYSCYFQSKISKLRASFDSQKEISNPLTFDAFITNCLLDSFSSVSQVEIILTRLSINHHLSVVI